MVSVFEKFEAKWKEECKSAKDPTKCFALLVLLTSRKVIKDLMDEIVTCHDDIDEKDQLAVLEMLSVDAKQFADNRATKVISLS